MEMLTEGQSKRQDRERVLKILRAYAWNSMAYLSLEDDKHWFFSQQVEGVASYALSHGVMVVCGDPVCAKNDMPAFLCELKEFASEHQYRMVFLFANGEFLPMYRSAGFGTTAIGEEAVFDLCIWNLHGGRVAKVRAAVNHAKKAGLVVKEYVPSRKRDKCIENEFSEISRLWLAQKHTAPLKFALGDIGFDFPNDKRYFYALSREGVMQGFIVFLPYRRATAYMADVTRRRPDAIYGTTELVFCESLSRFQEERIATASLGVAPLANVTATWRRKGFQLLCKYIYRHMNCIYGFRQLHAAKEKYAPTRWERVFIVSHPALLSPKMSYATADVLDSKGFHDYVDAFLKHHATMM